MTTWNMPPRVATRAEFISLLHALRASLTEQPEAWENTTLDSFLEALAAWTEDMDGLYKSRGRAVPAEPSWSLLGDMLLAARVYE